MEVCLKLFVYNCEFNDWIVIFDRRMYDILFDSNSGFKLNNEINNYFDSGGYFRDIIDFNIENMDSNI